MKTVLTSEQMKAVERFTIQEIGLESLLLMERAAWEVSRRILQETSNTQHVFMMAGTGNNGADGLAAARMLSAEGYSVCVMTLGNREHATVEWRYQYQLLEKLEIPVMDGNSEAEAAYAKAEECRVFVDALFGIGLNRELTGTYREAVKRFGELAREVGAFVLAVDIPSGVDASTGQLLGAAVSADCTVTFGYAKCGQYLYPGAAYCGELLVCSLGFLRAALEDAKQKTAAALMMAYEPEDIPALLPPRIVWGNKGSFGRVLVIAGSPHMAGAAYFAAASCYAAGAGLVTVVTPASNTAVLNTRLPEAIVYGYQEIPEEAELEPLIKAASAIVLGPGLGQSEGAECLWRRVLELREHQPMVLDADGLNLLAKHPEEGSFLDRSVVVTPHVKELSRLLHSTTAQTAADLRKAAENLTERFPVTAVCKDARTLIFDGENTCLLNLSGNQGMACGGSGDVLSGVIAGLLAQRMPPRRAAGLGVYLHGRAGDLAADRKGSFGMTASDVLSMLPEVFREAEEQKRNR